MLSMDPNTYENYQMDEAYQAGGANELITLMKKQNRMMKILMICMAGIMAIMLLSAVILVPKTVRILGEADAAMKNVQVAVENLAEVSEALAEADLSGMIEDTRALVNESSIGIAEAIGKLNQIEFGTLNKAISDFQAVVEPMARLFGR